MKGLIILDGPDGAGKTTLGQYMAKRYDGVYMHLTYRWKDKMFEYHTAALHRAVKMSADRLVIIDRLWPSEVCYANAYRDGSKWPLMWRMMERVINKVAGMYVICLPHNTREYLDEYRLLKASRAEMFDDIIPVVIEYHKLWDRMQRWPHAVRYDRFQEPVVRFVDLLEAKLVEHQNSQDKHISDPNNYNCLGHIGMAEFIVMCDWKSPRKRAWWPLYEYSGTALYLAQLWDRKHFEEHRFIWTTPGAKPDSSRYLLNRYELIPITLGDVAYKHIATPTGDYLRFGKPHWLCHPAYEIKFSKQHTLSSNIAAIVERAIGDIGYDDYIKRAQVYMDMEAMRFENSRKHADELK